MKKSLFLLLSLVALFITACSNDETYADQRKRENSAISRYLNDSSVNVISERQFFAQDSMTDVSKNEFVLLESSGIYLQIISKGGGEKLKDGETATVLCRFTERNLLTDSIICTNQILYWSAMVDKMSVTNTSGTFTASFDPASSVMYQVYGKSTGSTQVPNGWLAPLPYINLNRENTPEGIAHVRIIVPSTEGTYAATMSVYPCLYDITYARGI